jgi:5-methylcytosine-specific restriction endonuclease McrA
MQRHTKIYMDHFQYGEQDFIPCEVCSARAIDVHHLNGRGPGKDVIDNLMGLCRGCHDKAHQDPGVNEYSKVLHAKKLRT